MRPRGFSSATRSAEMSWRTIWQKTFCSRTRRAMSWPYCEPKSRIRMLSRSVCVMIHRGLLVGKPGKEFVQGGCIVDVAGTDESLPIDFSVLEKVHLPGFARHTDNHGDGVFPIGRDLMMDSGPFQPFREGEQRVKIHLS